MLIPKNAKDVKGLRDYLTQQRTQACSTGAAYTGPLKQVFDQLVSDIDAWLDKLPKDEIPGDWSLECQLDCLFNVLTQAQAAASLVTLEHSKLMNGEQFASALTVEINKRVTAGELFTKDGVSAHVKAQLDAGEIVSKERLTQLCSEAKIQGFGEGETKVRNEIAAETTATKLIGERKALLQAASLPLPEAELEKAILGGTDEQFAARKTAFETRRESLKKEGIQLASDEALANLWLDDAAYKGFEKTIKSLPQLKFNANPLAGAAGGGENKPAAPMLIV